MRNSLCSTEVATSKLQTQSLWKRYKYEGVNGGWQTSDKGRKILLTTDTTRKKVPTTEKGRHYLFVFRKKSILYFFFSTCLRSKRRYHQLYKFYWRDKSEKPKISCFDGRHKSLYKYTTKREYWSVSTERMKISTEQPTYSYTLPASNVWGKYFKLQQNAWWTEATNTIWKKKCY